MRQQSGDPLGLHSDGADVVVDVHGRTVNLRDQDEDGLPQPAVDNSSHMLLSSCEERRAPPHDHAGRLDEETTR